MGSNSLTASIEYDCRALGLCAGATDARYVTTTEVYPDSPRATPQQWNDAQAAAIVDQFRDAYKAGGVPPRH